jgi:hypothetical protein
LDDMVVLAADTPKGRQWADRALMRIRQEAEAIGVSPNAEKTRLVTITEPGASFAFLGFEFRWERSSKTGTWYSSRTPRPKKIIAVLKGRPAHHRAGPRPDCSWISGQRGCRSSTCQRGLRRWDRLWP